MNLNETDVNNKKLFYKIWGHKLTSFTVSVLIFLANQGKGTIVDVIRGVNVPLINAKMNSLLDLEEKIKNGEAERVEVRITTFIELHFCGIVHNFEFKWIFLYFGLAFYQIKST